MPNRTHEVRLITVSREFGAGGSELAADLGRRLGWPVVDRDLVRLVAERLRLDAETVEHFDEHPPSLLARIASVLIVPQTEAHSFPPSGDVPSHDAIAAATRRVLEDAADSPPVIIVGHGSQCIFAGRADAFHLRLVAPVACRIPRVMRRLSVDAPRAATLLRRADLDRQAYVQRYFHHDWRSELLYHLQLNTGCMEIDEAAALVEQMVRQRAGAGPAGSAPVSVLG